MGESEIFVINDEGGLESYPVLDNYKVGLSHAMMELSSFWNISKKDLDGTEDYSVWKKVNSRILNRKEILNVKLNFLTNLFCSSLLYTPKINT